MLLNASNFKTKRFKQLSYTKGLVLAVVWILNYELILQSHLDLFKIIVFAWPQIQTIFSSKCLRNRFSQLLALLELMILVTQLNLILLNIPLPSKRQNIFHGVVSNNVMNISSCWSNFLLHLTITESLKNNEWIKGLFFYLEINSVELLTLNSKTSHL